jgi:hypothetical protein
VGDLVVEIDSARDRHVVIILPHAHVVPTAALAAVSLTAASAIDQGQGRKPTISVVQLPCCKFTKHDTMFGARADFEYVDYGIAAHRRCMRVWRDVGGMAVAAKAVAVDGSKATYTTPRPLG